ncbi:MAG TPA: hypothetical protein VFN35_09800 [Ktedonobacteraceae bacterium]|nr:hypothetical protein [Ktedonobacteraceae bacterium]
MKRFLIVLFACAALSLALLTGGSVNTSVLHSGSSHAQLTIDNLPDCPCHLI